MTDERLAVYKQVQPQQQSLVAHMRGKLRFNLLPIEFKWDLTFISLFTKFNIRIGDMGKFEGKLEFSGWRDNN